MATGVWRRWREQGIGPVHVLEAERITRGAAGHGGGASAAQPRPARRRAGGRHRARRRLRPPTLHQQGEADPDEVSRRGAAARVQIYPKSPSQPLTALPRTAGLIGSQPGPPQRVPIGTGGVGMVGRQFILGTSVSVLRSEEHTSELQSLMRNSYAVFCLKTKK